MLFRSDLKSLIDIFEEVKDYPHPIVVHLNTQKGKGYAPAEAHKELFHFHSPFDLATGDPLHISESESYDDIFATHMLERMKKDKRIAVITAGTPGVLGFTPDRRREAGSQFIDVGIAEQEAVALASGMAKGGARPVFGVVSSFLQRAYDQLSQDVAINGNPMVLNIFYGSIAGMTDVTHLGWFDIPLVANIPGWVYLAPSCKQEYLSMLDWAINQTKYPVAVRVPNTMACDKELYIANYDDLNKNVVLHRGKRVAIFGAGSCLQVARDAAAILKSNGIDATVVNPRFLSGLDTELLEALKADHELVVTLEDGAIDGGYGEKIARYYGDSDMKVQCHGMSKEFLDRYSIPDVLKQCCLTPDTLALSVLKSLQ